MVGFGRFDSTRTRTCVVGQISESEQRIAESVLKQRVPTFFEPLPVDGGDPHDHEHGEGGGVPGTGLACARENRSGHAGGQRHHTRSRRFVQPLEPRPRAVVGRRERDDAHPQTAGRARGSCSPGTAAPRVGCLARFVRLSTAWTSWRSQNAPNSGDARSRRATSVFQAGSSRCSAIAARYSATIRPAVSSQSTITRRQRGSVKLEPEDVPVLDRDLLEVGRRSSRTPG